MKILFLDDDPLRTDKFKQRMVGHDVICVETPTAAKQALDTFAKFDIASLDHDLFGKIFQPSDENSGFEVCVHIEEMDNRDKPDKVICHSYNPDGVHTMMSLLITGIAAPFDSDEYWSHFEDEEQK